jgi:hypothetical protein
VHNFSVAGRVPQDLPTSVHTGQSQAPIDLPRLGQDSGAQAQSMQNFQTITPNVQTQNQSLVPASSSADIAGAHVSHNVAKSEDIQRVTASLAQYFGNAGAVGLQSPEPNMNSSLMSDDHFICCVSSCSTESMALGTATCRHGSTCTLFHLNSTSRLLRHFRCQWLLVAVMATLCLCLIQVLRLFKLLLLLLMRLPSENKKGEKKDTDAKGNEDGENKKSKDSKALKMFKIALADFVKEVLKPTWKDGQLSREVHKTIVKKVVDKVTSTVENTPPTKEKIELYMSFSKDKLNKLVQVTYLSLLRH